MVRALDFSPPKGTRACNPSIVRHDERLFCSVRTVDEQPSRTLNRSFLLSLDNLGAAIDQEELVARPGLANSPYQGPEDIRLISFQGALWGSFTVADHHPSALGQIAIAKLDGGTFVDLAIQDFGGYRLQKNWMPFVDSTGLGWIYQSDPTVVLRYQSEVRQGLEWKRWLPGWALDNQRGGSQLIPWDDGWLGVTHETIHKTRRHYVHRFMRLNSHFAVDGLSMPFYLVRPGVEFCSGLCRGQDGELWLSFGVADREAKIGRITEDAVRRLLRDAPPSTELSPPMLGYDYWDARALK